MARCHTSPQARRWRGPHTQFPQLQGLIPSFRGFHDDYLRAVRLYQQSGGEMVKVGQDREEEHLVAAFPTSQEGERILGRVGSALWLSERVPN